ncbi:MAG: glycosyltransferase [Candidatus Theseobacter exili]|nr:glycosyltransferase [Candidatus Theseobacter exili]
MKNVLILYVNRNSGHHIAALAIKKSIQEQNPTVNARVYDFLAVIHPILDKVVLNAYLGVVRKTPELWAYLYDNRKVKERLKRLQDAVHKKKLPRLNRLIERTKPDAVICTQAYPCGVMATYKEETGSRMPLISVVTDYFVHSYWIMNGVDKYIVPSEAVREKLLSEGILDDRIKAFGIPVLSKFSKFVSKDEARRECGIDTDSQVLLIMGGGSGLLPVKKILQSLRKMQSKPLIIALTGTNKALYEKLCIYREKTSSNVMVLSKTSKVDKLMTAADLMITKPGGLTVTEAIVKKLPMLIMNPLPGQEVKNTKFLAKNGLAKEVKSISKLPELVQNFLDDPIRIKEMKSSMDLFRKPDSSEMIAKMVLGKTFQPCDVPVPVL